MYAAAHRSNKESKSRAVANSIAQKKSGGKQGFRIIDNRDHLCGGSKTAGVCGQRVVDIIRVGETTRGKKLLQALNTLIKTDETMGLIHKEKDILVHFVLKKGKGGGFTVLCKIGGLEIKSLDEQSDESAANKVLKVINKTPIVIKVEVTERSGGSLEEFEMTLLHEIYLHLKPLVYTLVLLKNKGYTKKEAPQVMAKRLRDPDLDHRSVNEWLAYMKGAYDYTKKCKDKVYNFRLLWAVAWDLKMHFNNLTKEEQKQLAKVMDEYIYKYAKNKFDWGFNK